MFYDVDENPWVVMVPCKTLGARCEKAWHLGFCFPEHTLRRYAAKSTIIIVVIIQRERRLLFACQDDTSLVRKGITHLKFSLCFSVLLRYYFRLFKIIFRSTKLRGTAASLSSWRVGSRTAGVHPWKFNCGVDSYASKMKSSFSFKKEKKNWLEINQFDLNVPAAIVSVRTYGLSCFLEDPGSRMTFTISWFLQRALQDCRYSKHAGQSTGEQIKRNTPEF